MTLEQKNKMVSLAIQLVSSRINGSKIYTPANVQHPQTFDLEASGYCTRLVRMLHEYALDIGAFQWAYQAPDAIALEAILSHNKLGVNNPQPGDIICINKNSGEHGHVGLFVGKTQWYPGDCIVENSSSLRGKPQAKGTKVTPYSEISNRVSGIYRTYKENVSSIKIIDAKTNAVIWPIGKRFYIIDNGNHLADQNKLYVKEI
jgi:hypothetical protein